MKKPESQPAHQNGSVPVGDEKQDMRIAAPQQTPEETEEVIFSMTTHAMREPEYSREKEGMMAMTVAFAREDQHEIATDKRAIHQRLGRINERMKLRSKREEI
ncbi:MAG: hypothetical protein ABJO72_02680 [Hyphomicrobiales bacterium]